MLDVILETIAEGIDVPLLFRRRTAGEDCLVAKLSPSAYDGAEINASLTVAAYASSYENASEIVADAMESLTAAADDETSPIAETTVLGSEVGYDSPTSMVRLICRMNVRLLARGGSI